ncbi:hypothetical protein ILYODFUR_035275 [Ilyodon furcidens]|uniref:Uncharacterized protein n=1 Tax=Ilyodon furcidens TaxID=33524 RepID=A0ABV0T6H7_9TELE
MQSVSGLWKENQFATRGNSSLLGGSLAQILSAEAQTANFRQLVLFSAGVRSPNTQTADRTLVSSKMQSFDQYVHVRIFPSAVCEELRSKTILLLSCFYTCMTSQGLQL